LKYTVRLGFWIDKFHMLPFYVKRCLTTAFNKYNTKLYYAQYSLVCI
jgi:hypothetical protein